MLSDCREMLGESFVPGGGHTEPGGRVEKSIGSIGPGCCDKNPRSYHTFPSYFGMVNPAPPLEGANSGAGALIHCRYNLGGRRRPFSTISGICSKRFSGAGVGRNSPGANVRRSASTWTMSILSNRSLLIAI